MNNEDLKKYPPIALANTFLQMYGKEGIGHMKLQKLSYFAHGWWLAFNETPFLTERPQVWQYGPVFKSLYNILKSFGSNLIFEPQKALPFEELKIINDNDKIEQLIKWVWKKYGSYSALVLSDMTHQPETPWWKIAKEHNYCVKKNTEIQDSDMEKYFKNEATELDSNGG